MTTDELILEGFANRLEKLTRTLIGRGFDGADDLWKLQTDLLDLQRDIQSHISDLKLSSRTNNEARGVLNEARQLRFTARRFGDAIAWIMLGLDRQVILPLARNEPVPVPPDDHSSRAMVGLA